MAQKIWRNLYVAEPVGNCTVAGQSLFEPMTDADILALAVQIMKPRLAEKLAYCRRFKIKELRVYTYDTCAHPVGTINVADLKKMAK